VSGAVAKPRGKRRANDAYYTPDELANRLVGLLPVQPTDLALEPSAGGGAFVRALQARGALVCGVDIDPDSVGVKQAQHHAWTGDFRDHEWNDPPYDWIVGNPPYKDAQLHVQHALDNTGRHVAMLLRMGFLAGQQRQRELWSDHRPRCVWVLSKRPSFTGGGTDSTDYCWIWWDKLHTGPTTVEWVKTPPRAKKIK